MVHKYDVQEGDIVRITGFTCIKDGETREVKSGGNGLYIDCSSGKHWLDAQIDDNTQELIGIEKVND